MHAPVEAHVRAAVLSSVSVHRPVPRRSPSTSAPITSGGSSRVIRERVRRWYGSRPLKCWRDSLPTSGSPVGLHRQVDGLPPRRVAARVGDRREHRLARRVDVPLVHELVLARGEPRQRRAALAESVRSPTSERSRAVEPPRAARGTPSCGRPGAPAPARARCPRRRRAGGAACRRGSPSSRRGRAGARGRRSPAAACPRSPRSARTGSCGRGTAVMKPRARPTASNSSRSSECSRISKRRPRPGASMTFMRQHAHAAARPDHPWRRERLRHAPGGRVLDQRRQPPLAASRASSRS